MPKCCKIIIKNFEIIVKLNSSLTAKKVWEALPIISKANTWGNEIYFNAPVDVELEKNAREVIELGEIVFWPSGRVIAIGFGETPISKKDEIKLVEKCNVWANTTFDLKKLTDINSGEVITVERVL